MTLNARIKTELKYNGTRKELVKDIATALDAKAQYLAAPTFAYKVDFFTINRDNTLEWDTGDMTMDACKAIGALKEAGRFEYGRTWIDGELVQVTLQVDALNTPDEADIAPHAGDSAPEGTTTPEAVKPLTFGRTIFVPDDLTAEQKANLLNLIHQKANIFAKAFPGFKDIAFTKMDGKDWIEFPWFEVTENDDAQHLFLNKMMAMVKAAKRISSKPQVVTNPKYQFRCFLLRLGFIGKEYGPARKVLLSHLEGNSAWLRGSREA